jgi:exopolysaccharide biosynthesis polyprenyl glycosylphosphotransferase
VGLVDDDPLSNADVLGTVAALPDIVAAQNIDRVIVAFSRTPQQETLLLLRALKGHVGISVVPRMYELLSWRASIEELHGIPLLHVAPQQASVAARAAKRALDLTVASTLLVVSAPVLLAIAAVIRVTSPGPALFRQERIGRNGKPFQIYKFRTMVVDADDRKGQLAALNEADGPIFKIRKDPRVTRVGRFLRQTSMDETPQLLNVIRGEMSLVGPRPFPPAEAARIGGWASTRFSVPPGITGLWQVSGRSELTNDDLLHLDSVYVSSWSFLWDLRILLRTPHAVLRREGAY